MTIEITENQTVEQCARPISGPEHYREADRLLAEAKGADPDANRADVALLLKFAEIHMGLAQAAATALCNAAEQIPFGEFRAWQNVAGSR